MNSVTHLQYTYTGRFLTMDTLCETTPTLGCIFNFYFRGFFLSLICLSWLLHVMLPYPERNGGEAPEPGNSGPYTGIRPTLRDCFVSSCWPTRGHAGRSTEDSNPVMTLSAGGAKGWSDHRFRAPKAYTAQLLTLHQHKANSQYRICSKYCEKTYFLNKTLLSIQTISRIDEKWFFSL